ncbi:MAG: penicillin-binding protein 2 [Candidatus Omnitrophota bacterium]
MQKYKITSQKFNLSFSTELLRKIYFCGFFLLILTLFYCQITKGEYYFQRAKNNYVRVIPLRAPRGSIVDKNGVLIAYDKANFNISVIPHQLKNKKDYLFKEISDYLGRDVSLINNNYNKNLKSRFSPVNILIDIDKTTALKLKENFGDTILINPQPTRYYPLSYQFAHIIGYVKEAASFYEKLKKYGYTPLERVGFSGIEQYYDTYLNGEDGGDLIEVNAKGKTVGFLGKQMPLRGKDIHLTVDSRIQESAWESLKGKKGAVILMDSDSGEITSLCSYPAYDPNRFIEGKNINTFLTDKESPLLNRALQSAYPIGSIFKPILSLAALEEKKITQEKAFFCSGQLKFEAAEFHCWSTHGEQNLVNALAHSCNIYFYNLGLLLGPDIISHWAKKFGLDSLSGIDLPYEKEGFVPTVKWKQKTLKHNWWTGDTLNLSIGQGFMSITPLQITVAINAFANGGYLVTPRLIKKIDNIDSGLSNKTPLGINNKNLKTIKEGMRGAVKFSDGTAHLLEKLNLEISGKTGTAQTKGKSHSWFVGFFPYKDKTYTICVFLENGGSSFEAVKVAYYFLRKVKENNLLDDSS